MLSFSICRALQVFEIMKRNRILDVTHFNALINLCARKKDIVQAFGIYDHMISSAVRPDMTTYISLIDACGGTNNWHIGLSLLEKVPLPTFTFYLNQSCLVGLNRHITITPFFFE